MLPDFRVVTIAVISTFLFAVTVGFYTSSRLINERKPRPESLAAIEENPLNRIALNWPEPVQPPQNALDLDFAVTAKVQRNPVRDVTEEPESKVAANPPVAIPNGVPHRPRVEAPVIEAPKIAAPGPEEIKPEVAQIEPPKLENLTIPPAPAVLPPQAKAEEEVPTSSIVEAPRVNHNLPGQEPVPSQDANRAPAPPAVQVASRPDPETEEAKPASVVETGPAIRPDAAKPAKRAKKKAKKAAKAAPRPRPRVVTTTATPNSFFPFFGFPQ